MRGLACLCLPAFRGIASDEAPPSSVVGRGLGAALGAGPKAAVLAPPTNTPPPCVLSWSSGCLSGRPWEKRLGLRVPFS